MLRKLALSAMLIFVEDPNVRLAVGFLVSFFCLIVVFFTRPLVSASLDVIMLSSLITQTLTLSCKSPKSIFQYLSLLLCRHKHVFTCLVDTGF